MTTATASHGRSSSGLLGFIFGRGPTDRLDDVPAWIAALIMLAGRIYLALPFWNAGNARLTNWDSQFFLFEQVHPLPILGPQTSAYITTGAELVLPVLLVLGLLGRWAGLGLAVMAFTIYFIIGGAFAIFWEQWPWMVVGVLIFILGPGRLSADYAIRRHLLRTA